MRTSSDLSSLKLAKGECAIFHQEGAKGVEDVLVTCGWKVVIPATELHIKER